MNYYSKSDYQIICNYCKHKVTASVSMKAYHERCRKQAQRKQKIFLSSVPMTGIPGVDGNYRRFRP